MAQDAEPQPCDGGRTRDYLKDDSPGQLHIQALRPRSLQDLLASIIWFVPCQITSTQHELLTRE